MRQVRDGEWQREQEREEEHPLHARHYRIACNQRTAGAEIESEDDVVGEAVDNAYRFGLRGAAAAEGALEDEPEDAPKAQCHTEGLLPCNGFFQEYGGHEHGEDGRCGAHHREVNRRGVCYGMEESELRCQQTQHPCAGETYHVTQGHPFAWRQQRDKPEQGPGHQGPHAEQHDGVQAALGGYVATHNYVDAEDDICCCTGYVACRRPSVYPHDFTITPSVWL